MLELGKTIIIIGAILFVTIISTGFIIDNYIVSIIGLVMSILILVGVVTVSEAKERVGVDND